MTVTETEGIRYFRTSTSIILFHLLRFLLYRRAINFQSSIFHHLTFFHPGKISIVAKMTFKGYSRKIIGNDTVRYIMTCFMVIMCVSCVVSEI